MSECPGCADPDTDVPHSESCKAWPKAWNNAYDQATEARKTFGDTRGTFAETPIPPVLNEKDFYWSVLDHDDDFDGFLHIVCTRDGSSLKIQLQDILKHLSAVTGVK